MRQFVLLVYMQGQLFFTTQALCRKTRTPYGIIFF